LPSHLVHAYLDRLHFGRVYWKVHRLMDSAYPFFRGQHRFFWHDPLSAIAIASDSYPNDSNAICSALLHIQADNAASANPLLHEQLEMLAKADASKRRKHRKKEKPQPLSPEFEKALRDLEKIIEIRRMMGLL
jgi:hypothetical protein